MHFRPTIGFLLIAASMGFAEDKLCNPATASVVSQGAVTVKTVTLSGKWGQNAATVFLPNKEIADGVVTFSHSAIHPDSGETVDLFPLALTLAGAGAAVIVPNRTLEWRPKDDLTNREGAVVVCAAHWMVDNVKVFNDGEPVTDDQRKVVREGFGYVGPRVCDPAAVGSCRLMRPLGAEPAPGYRRHSVWVPVGETEGGDNTNSIISDRGLQPAQFLQHALGLAPIGAVVSGSSTVARHNGDAQ